MQREVHAFSLDAICPWCKPDQFSFGRIQLQAPWHIPTVDLLDAALQCLDDWRNLSETDALQELSIIGIQVVTKLSRTDDWWQYYRGITLSPVISKLFEYGVMEKYDTYFPENDRQFGFKEKMGCSHAVFVLRQCVEYFVSRGSTVFMAALDATKAFDRLNHIKLFHRTCDADIPVCIIKLLLNWYWKITVFIKWNNCYSSPCSLKSGIRQGGVFITITV